MLAKVLNGKYNQQASLVIHIGHCSHVTCSAGSEKPEARLAACNYQTLYGGA